MDSEVCMDLMILSCQWGGMDRGEINLYFQFFPLERTKQMSLAPQGLDMVSKYQVSSNGWFQDWAWNI